LPGTFVANLGLKGIFKPSTKAPTFDRPAATDCRQAGGFVTVQTAFRGVSNKFLNGCVERDISLQSPAMGFNRQQRKSRDLVLTNAEYQLFWQACAYRSLARGPPWQNAAVDTASGWRRL